MKIVYITPRKDDLLVEIPEKASVSLNNFIRQTQWLKWQQMNDVNGKARMQWYIVVDTISDKEYRLSKVAKFLNEVEKYMFSPRICPHDLYYEDYEKYFSLNC